MNYANARAAADRHLTHLSARLAVLDHEVGQLKLQQQELSEAQDRDRAKAELYAKGIAALNQVVEEVGQSNLRKLTSLVNTALKTIFFDQDLEFRVETDVKWNTTVYRFEVLHDGVPGNTSNFGGSVYAVIALVLKVVFNRYAKRYPLIVADESLHFVSKEYISRTSAFMRELSRELDMKFILVTHQPEFASEADQNYMARPTKDAGTRFEAEKAL